MRRPATVLAAALVAVAMILVSVGCADKTSWSSAAGGPDAAACLARPDVVTLTGEQGKWSSHAEDLPDGAGIDARTAWWRRATASDTPFVLKAGGSGGSDVCVVGDEIYSSLPDSTPWERWHDIYGMTIELPEFTVNGMRIHNMGDGISFTSHAADNWTIRDVHMSEIHDDCVENDYANSGLIEDSLLEGCYVPLSSEGGSWMDPLPNGLDERVTVRDTLIWHKPMPTVYKGAAPGTGPLFKWSDVPDEGYGPMLTMRNVTIRVDQEPGFDDLEFPTYTDPSTGDPQPYLDDCSNNTIVWLGSGPYPADVPSCFTVTTDRAVWDDAVAAWKAAH